jgi:hypothetical protein
MMGSRSFIPEQLSGRNRRLLSEWRLLEDRFSHRPDIAVGVQSCNAAGLPVSYRVDYRIRSICGVENVERLGEKGVENPPLFANAFRMDLVLPPNYPCVDGAPVFRFCTQDEQGNPIPHPWHPNIRWFGEMAGRVCLNMDDTYTDLAWGVERIAGYLRYDLYHAVAEPPFPEDMQVAAWVIRQGEPQEWIYFDQD